MERNGRFVHKHCKICGDRALGFNFNGLSCESCKAFFRRNALKQKIFFCQKEEKCVISKSTRKYCKACRLKRCYEIGMKKELVLFNRDSRMQIKLEKLKRLAELENQTNNTSNDEQDGDGNDDSNSETETEDLGDESANPKPSVLQIHDIGHLDEVTNAMTVFGDERNCPIARTVTNLVEACNMPSIYISKIIKFCKRIEAYKTLGQNDKLNVLKSFFGIVNSVRFSFLYRAELDGVPMENESTHQASLLKLSVFEEWHNSQIGPQFRKFMINFNYEMENDPKIRDLLVAMFLFGPHNTAVISCPEFVRYQYFVYQRLLKIYLEEKYKDEQQAKEKYDRLMLCIKDAEMVRHIVVNIYTAIVDQLSHVLKEIYGLT